MGASSSYNPINNLVLMERIKIQGTYAVADPRAIRSLLGDFESILKDAFPGARISIEAKYAARVVVFVDLKPVAEPWNDVQRGHLKKTVADIIQTWQTMFG